MLRSTIAIVFAFVAIEPAMSADQSLPSPSSHHVRHRVAVNLPRGLPRPHYQYRTTITYHAPYIHRWSGPRLTTVYENPEDLYAPDYTEVGYVTPLIRAPLLPGFATLPGYYGSRYSYEYQGPYYGGPYVPYWDRLPYACGVYGYC